MPLVLVAILDGEMVLLAEGELSDVMTVTKRGMSGRNARSGALLAPKVPLRLKARLKFAPLMGLLRPGVQLASDGRQVTESIPRSLMFVALLVVNPLLLLLFPPHLLLLRLPQWTPVLLTLPLLVLSIRLTLAVASPYFPEAYSSGSVGNGPR
jgi:hypothetical protein